MWRRNKRPASATLPSRYVPTCRDSPSVGHQLRDYRLCAAAADPRRRSIGVIGAYLAVTIHETAGRLTDIVGTVYPMTVTGHLEHSLNRGTVIGNMRIAHRIYTTRID